MLRSKSTPKLAQRRSRCHAIRAPWLNISAVDQNHRLRMIADSSTGSQALCRGACIVPVHTSLSSATCAEFIRAQSCDVADLQPLKPFACSDARRALSHSKGISVAAQRVISAGQSSTCEDVKGAWMHATQVNRLQGVCAAASKKSVGAHPCVITASCREWALSRERPALTGNAGPVCLLPCSPCCTECTSGDVRPQRCTDAPLSTLPALTSLRFTHDVGVRLQA